MGSPPACWPTHIPASGLTAGEARLSVAAVIAMAEPVESHYLWRPCLRDPAGEFVLEGRRQRPESRFPSAIVAV
jgi:hypothetical protein